MIRLLALFTLASIACGARSTPPRGRGEPDRFQREIAAMMTGKRGDPAQPAEIMVGDVVRAKQKGLWTRARVSAASGASFDIVFENGEPQTGLKMADLQRDQSDLGTFECRGETTPDLAAFCTSDCASIQHADLRAYCSGSCDAITSANYREICKVVARLDQGATEYRNACDAVENKSLHRLVCFQMAREGARANEDRAAHRSSGGGHGPAAPAGSSCKPDGELSDPVGSDCCSGKVRPVSRGAGLQPDYACCEAGTSDCS